MGEVLSVFLSHIIAHCSNTHIAQNTITNALHISLSLNTTIDVADSVICICAILLKFQLSIDPYQVIKSLSNECCWTHISNHTQTLLSNKIKAHSPFFSFSLFAFSTYSLLFFFLLLFSPFLFCCS
jgi:hypothetical protein